MKSDQALSRAELQGLEDLACIGLGHAGVALGQLVGGGRLVLAGPRAIAAEPTELAPLFGGDQPVVAARLEISGALAGQFLLVLPARVARRFAGLLLGADPAQPLPDEALSAISEACNIAGSACLTALGQSLRIRLMPSVPELREASLATVLSSLRGSAPASPRCATLAARFRLEDSDDLVGYVVLVPDPASVDAALDRLAP